MNHATEMRPVEVPDAFRSLTQRHGVSDMSYTVWMPRLTFMASFLGEACSGTGAALDRKYEPATIGGIEHVDSDRKHRQERT
jgi:hypothetical protein